MFNGIMNLMNNLEDRYYKDINDNVIENTENEYNILLGIEPITIAIHGLAVATAGVLHFESEDVTTILVDNNYLNMSETGKRFIIAHELGHIIYQIEKINSVNYIRNIEDEFEADEYALQELGLEVALEGLNEMRTILVNMYAEYKSIHELDLRIENLMNKSMVTC